MDQAGIWSSILTGHWNATVSGPFFDLVAAPAEFTQLLPRELVAALEVFGGHEGFLGEHYLRLYRLDELLALNFAYSVPDMLRQFVVFGSNGGGEAFGVGINETIVVRFPLIPMRAEYVEACAPSFSELLKSMAGTSKSPAADPESLGKESHCIHPLCLGGSPTDLANRTWVTVVQHAELCRYWNKIYADAVAGQQGNA